MSISQLNEILMRKVKILSETTWDRKADQPQVEKWLLNFADDNERIHLLYLLSQFMYFGDLQMKELLKALYRDLYRYRIVEHIRRSNNNTTDLAFIQEEFKQAEYRTMFIGMGNPSESGTHLLYFFRQENKISKYRFINAFEIFKRNDKGKDELRYPNVNQFVFIDDFCGSGSQAIQYSTDIVERLKAIDPNIHTSYLMLFATKHGKENVKKTTKFDFVEALVELDESFKCFDSSSRYFKHYLGVIDKNFAQTTSEKYGVELFKSILGYQGIIDPDLSELADKHKLGFGNCQLLIGFVHNTPDNTLPIIWYDEGHVNWYPIFKRYNKIY